MSTPNDQDQPAEAPNPLIAALASLAEAQTPSLERALRTRITDVYAHDVDGGHPARVGTCLHIRFEMIRRDGSLAARGDSTKLQRAN